MKKFLFLLLSAIIFVSCSNKSEQQEKKSDENIETATDIEIEKPMVLDFSAEWCVWCKKLEPTLKELEKKYNGSVEFQTIDTDKESQLAATYKIKGLPTLVFINKNGEEVGRIEGFTSAENIEKEIAKIQ